MHTLSAGETAARLGVKADTVYAYVSRGTLHSWREPGSRTSRFDPEEVERLARRGRPRRATRPPALDFTIQTSLTAIVDHDVLYRGESAIHLADKATFEEVARLLWTGQHDEPAANWRAAPVVLPAPSANRDRLRMAVVLASAADPFRSDLTARSVAERAGSLIATMTEALGSTVDSRTARLHLDDGRPPRRGTIAARLWGRLAGVRPTQGLVASLNAALVLLADHELAVSTLAARVAASARADPYAVVLTGLGPLSGTLHGGASRYAYQLLQSASEAGPEPAIAQAMEIHQRVPGFGHPLYPLGDPRARALLEHIRAASPDDPVLATADCVISAVHRRTDLEPNVDMALAVLTLAARMPEDAGEAIFTIARTAGWIAHAIEEYSEQPLRFRARAVAAR